MQAQTDINRSLTMQKPVQNDDLNNCGCGNYRFFSSRISFRNFRWKIPYFRTFSISKKITKINIFNCCFCSIVITVHGESKFRHIPQINKITTLHFFILNVPCRLVSNSAGNLPLLKQFSIQY